MKQAIRALSIATTALWILLVLFSVTSVYSALQIGFGFGKPQASASSGVLTISLPFFIFNGGFYDISDLNVTTGINNSDGTPISNSTTLVPLISRGSRVDGAHNLSVSMDSIISRDLTSLLFQDSVFDVDMFVTLKHALVIPLQLSSNMTLPWGAPLANLSIGEISFVPINLTHFRIITPVSFENHSFFPLNGTMRLELVDDLNQGMGAGVADISVPPMNSCDTWVEVVVRSDEGIPTEARISFETSAFNFGPVVIPLG